jgi:hypothetical protein
MTNHHALVYVLTLNKVTAKLEKSSDPIDLIRVDQGVCFAIDYARRKHGLRPTERAILEPITAARRAQVETIMSKQNQTFIAAWRQIHGR